MIVLGVLLCLQQNPKLLNSEPHEIFSKNIFINTPFDCVWRRQEKHKRSHNPLQAKSRKSIM